MTRRRRAGRPAAAAVLTAALLALAPALPASAGPPVGGYTRTPFALGSPDSPVSFQLGSSNPVNRSGVVAGSAQSYGFREPDDAVLYDTRTRALTFIGTLPGSRSAIANDVNDGGDAVGTAGTEIDGGPTLAFVWTPEAPTIHTLGSLDPLEPDSGANAINNPGAVVGWTYTPDSGYTGHAFVWDPAVKPVRMRDLGTLGGVDSVAYGINAGGTVVGSATTRRHVVRPVVWSAGTHAITDIGTLPGYDSGVARDVNDRGLVVGEDFNASAPEQTRAFVWNPATRAVTPLSDPDGLPSRASAVNLHGVVVGRIDQPPVSGSDAPVTRAVVWNACSPLTVLPGEVGRALGITRQELIVGVAASGPVTWVKAGPCS